MYGIVSAPPRWMDGLVLLLLFFLVKENNNSSVSDSRGVKMSVSDSRFGDPSTEDDSRFGDFCQKWQMTINFWNFFFVNEIWKIFGVKEIF